MTATYTWDVFSSLDGFGSYGEQQRMVLGGNILAWNSRSYRRLSGDGDGYTAPLVPAGAETA